MLDKSNIQNIYEMTPLQEGMFFHTLYDDNSSAYFEQTRDRISGQVDVRLFELAWQQLVERHDIFRTIFVNKKHDKPLQIVLKKRPIPFHYQDLQNEEEYSQQKICDDYAETDKSNKFDLGKEPLMRIALFRLDDDRFEMVWSLHHILLDAWSLNVVQQEFIQTYNALKRGHSVGLPVALPFSRYLKWLKQQDKTKTREYWKDYLEGYTTPAALPKSTASDDGYQLQTETFFLSEKLSSELQAYASGQQLTLGVLLQTLWGVLVGALSQRSDVVFALTVSGRPAELEGIENTVGLFINAIPIRVRIGQHTFRSLLQEMKNGDANSKLHHYYSLADLQAETVLKQRLFDHILVLENVPDTDNEERGEQDFHITHSEHFDHTNYDLTLQITPGEKIGFTFLYNAAAYDVVFMQQMELRLNHLMSLLLAQDEEALLSLSLLPPSDQSLLQQQPTTDSLIVTSSFTAEPLAPAFDYWLSTFQLSGQLKFAEYNQVFQQLLDPASLLHKHNGLSCILLRFEDWLHNRDVTDSAEVCEYLENNFSRLQNAFDSYPRSGIWFVAIFPLSTHLGLPEAVTNCLTDLNKRWQAWLAEKEGVRLIDIQLLAKQYQTLDLFDARSDDSGHMPFTETYYSVLGSYLARQWVAKKHPPFKVIAIDCDNTLWKGICGEDGIKGLQITHPFRWLQQALIEKYEQGFLLVLCSKNNEADVWEVFDSHADMLLTREHIVAARINWSHKSSNLKSLALELNLGLDSFVFLDDSGLECSEVMSACPEVLTVQLPENTNAIPDWFSHIWALDRLKVTDEDQLRSTLYQAEKQRNYQRKQVDSLDNFLSELELEVTMSACQDFQVERLAQLSQRTNQFNLNGIRFDEKDIQAKVAADNQMCWSIQVSDRFGRYGTVGLLIAVLRGDDIVISSFLLSCRVLGRGVETAIMFGLRRFAEENKVKYVIADYQSTGRNLPVLNFLQSHGWSQLEDGRYTIDARELPAELDSVSWTDTPAENPAEQKQSGVVRPFANKEQIQTEEGSQATSHHDWWVTEVNTDNLKHRPFLTALTLHQGKLILPELKPFSLGQVSQRAEFVAAQTPVQAVLLGLWEAVLGQDNLGIRDDFFKVGGHSLLAVRLMNRVEQEFGYELPIHLLFQHPSVEQFSNMLKEYKSDSAQMHCIALQSTLAVDTLPLFLLPGYAGSILNLQPLASAMKERHVVYALQTPGLDDEGNMPESIEALAEYHIQALKAIQPSGPYQLLGHSLGGVVAFEMVRQLLDKGDEVAFFGILDMHAPGLFLEQAKSMLSRSLLLIEFAKEFDIATGDDLDFYYNDNTCFEEKLNRVCQSLKKKDWQNDDASKVKKWMSVRKNSIINYTKYRVNEGIHCPLHLFNAEETISDNEAGLDQFRGWKSVVSAEIKEFTVCGGHMTMLAHPQANNLSQQIMKYLQ